MGCGGSAPAQQQESHKQQQHQQQPAAAAQPQKPPELTQEEKNEIAVRGLKDALNWAVDGAIETSKQEDTWKEEEIQIKVPAAALDKINALKEKVEQVPLVGSSLGEALIKTTEPFEENFLNAAMTVSADESTITVFKGIVNDLNTEGAMALCKSGGVTACVDYLGENAKVQLTEQMTPVVNKVMEEHPLTKIWKGSIEKYNSAAEKVSGIEPLEFDLNQYVLDSTLESILKLMMRKEKEIRAAPAQAVSIYVQQAFGQDPSKWKKA